MVAPGNNLEFYESAAFVARVLGHEEIRAAIQTQLRNNPRAGMHVCGPLHTLDLTVGGVGVAYIYGRNGQRINIAYVFDFPGEEASFKTRLAEMRRQYCGQNERSRS